jgi:predicted metal-dependent enzyme (double-stranded beta helix superfamily)
MKLNELINNLNNDLSMPENKNKKLYHFSHYLEIYNGNEWIEKVNFNPTKNYTINLLYRNDTFEIYIICWNPNQESKIHNHSKRGCLMKVLRGELLHEIYTKKLRLLNGGHIYEDKVKYIHDDVGYHKIINGNQKTVTMHIYSPSNFKTVTFSKL